MKTRWLEILEDIAIGVALLVLVFAIAGCANMFSAKTTVHVENEGCVADYTSTKEQEGLTANMCGGKIATAKSGTLESAVAAALEVNALLLKQLLPLLQDAAALGAGS